MNVLQEMRRLNQFKLFTTVDKKIFIDPKSKTVLFFYPEDDTPLLKVYNRLQIPFRFVKYLYLSRFIYKFIRIIPTQTMIRQIRN